MLQKNINIEAEKRYLLTFLEMFYLNSVRANLVVIVEVLDVMCIA